MRRWGLRLEEEVEVVVVAARGNPSMRDGWLRNSMGARVAQMLEREVAMRL